MSERKWVGTVDWAYEEERPAISKGARMVVDYADGRPRETFLVDDVRDNEDGVSVTIDVHREGHDAVSSFRWYGAHDESPAQPSEED